MRLFAFSFMAGMVWTVIIAARLAWLNGISRGATPRVRRNLPLIKPASPHNTNVVLSRLRSLPKTGCHFQSRPARFFILFTFG